MAPTEKNKKQKNKKQQKTKEKQQKHPQTKTNTPPPLPPPNKKKSPTLIYFSFANEDKRTEPLQSNTESHEVEFLAQASDSLAKKPHSFCPPIEWEGLGWGGPLATNNIDFALLR